MASTFLDADARTAFTRAIEDIERASATEVVVAVRRRSASYLHANIALGAAAAFAGLAAMLFSAHEFSLPSILIDPFVVGGVAGALAELLPGVKRVLTPHAMRQRHVLRAARATFVERGIHRTRDRSGLLVYVSWLEGEVALVADTGVERAMSGSARADAARALTAAFPAGGAAVARALAELAPALAAALPRRTDDVNELPDAIDSDLERADRGAP